MDTDVSLAARLAADLDATFPALVAAHQDRLFTLALRLLGDPRDAEEVAQDALVRAFRAIAGYPPGRTAELRLRPWLASIAINLAHNRRRRIADRRPPARLEPLLTAGFEPVDEATPGPAGVSLRRERVAELAGVLLQLPPSIREAIVLRHVDGLTVAEAAAVLGRPEGTVKAQVSRGLGRLAELLDPATTLGEPGAAASSRRSAGAGQSTPMTTITQRRGFAAAEVLR